MVNTPAGTSEKALPQSCWRRRQSNDTKNNKEEHQERGHARQLRDVVGHGDELVSAQIKVDGSFMFVVRVVFSVDIRCQNTNHLLLLDKHSAKLAGYRAEVAKDGRQLLLGVLLTDVGGCEGSLTTSL